LVIPDADIIEGLEMFERGIANIVAASAENK
jgi:hypothetical protein